MSLSLDLLSQGASVLFGIAAEPLILRRTGTTAQCVVQNLSALDIGEPSNFRAPQQSSIWVRKDAFGTGVIPEVEDIFTDERGAQYTIEGEPSFNGTHWVCLCNATYPA